jgi:hypothetical protein
MSPSPGRRPDGERARLYPAPGESGPFIVRAIVSHQLSHACFVERDHVIETLAPRRSHKSLDEWILPRAVRGRDHFLNPHCLRGGLEVVECVIAIVDQIPRRLVPRNASRNCWVVHAAVGCVVTATCRMRRRSWARSTRTNTRRQVTVGNHEEIDRDDLADVISQERAPRLRGRLAPAPQQLVALDKTSLTEHVGRALARQGGVTPPRHRRRAGPSDLTVPFSCRLEDGLQYAQAHRDASRAVCRRALVGLAVRAASDRPRTQTGRPPCRRVASQCGLFHVYASTHEAIRQAWPTHRLGGSEPWRRLCRVPPRS